MSREFAVVDPMLVGRIRAEFLEMPGLRLTLEQTQRLCGVEAELCRAVLQTLVDARFLRRKSNGVYARVMDGDPARRRPVKADLGRDQGVREAS